MLCWGLWCSRNDCVWKGANFYNRAFVVHAALSFWRNWKQVNELSDTYILPSNVVDQWKPPIHGRLKLNTNVALDGSSSVMGLGWIIKDDAGRFIAAKSESIVGVFNVKEAEAVSIREALSWLKGLGYGDVDVETNSQLVFHALSSDSFSSSFCLIIDDIKETTSQIHDVVF
ncbi:uncharacterized protein LOC116033287 [Ipomoea triloba]|uniref:uncharacterized protein LOC116033287 n=1 Tax=Ipomoea triloba TaxID=35885 RepID=UPI00125D5764|nr:uncharacterized protein LOC116033287 [Ipomoea triloba]